MAKKTTKKTRQAKPRKRAPRFATINAPEASPVAGQMYENNIVPGPLVADGDECMGICHHSTQVIDLVEQWASVEEGVECIFHEGIEGLNERFELGLTHQQMTLLSEGLTPYWLSWIMAQ